MEDRLLFFSIMLIFSPLTEKEKFKIFNSIPLKNTCILIV